MPDYERFGDMYPPDYESPNIEAAAYLAREADPPDDDRPSAAELNEYPDCPLCGDPIDYCQGHGELNAWTPLGEA